MRSSFARCLLGLLIGLLTAASAAAQDTFSNPAMEPQDEFQKAFTHARMVMRQGRPEEAIQEFRQAAKLKKDQCADCFLLIGQISLQLQNYKDAAAAFRQAAELKPPNQAEMYNALGVALYFQGDKKSLEEAAVALKRSIELSGGKVPRAYYNLGYTLIKSGKTDEGVAALKTYLEVAPDAYDAAQVKAIMANPKLAGERLAFPFKVKSTAGQELSLDKFKGKVVLLDFWASWCGPCREEMPDVVRIYKKFSKENFVLVGINLDTNRDAFDNYTKQQGMDWPQYYDGRGWNNEISRLYNVSGIPHTVLIDQEGIVRATGLRGERLSVKIDELLKKPASASK